MSLLVYVNSISSVGKRLESTIEAVAPQGRTEVYRDMNSLTRRLHQPRGMLRIAVLFAGTRKDLDDILSIQDLLRDLRKIIVLPDSKENTIGKGHALRPRYLTYADSDFEDLRAVLMKMLGLTNSNRKEA